MYHVALVRDASEPIELGVDVPSDFEDLSAPSHWLDELEQIRDLTGGRMACGRVLMFESLPRDARKHLKASVFWDGPVDFGEYRIRVSWPDCHDLTVRARYEPMILSEKEKTVGLLDFRLSGTPRGRDMLAHARRTQPMPDVVEKGLRQVLGDNIDLAMRLVAAHSVGLPLPSAEPMLRAGLAFGMLPARRP